MDVMTGVDTIPPHLRDLAAAALDAARLDPRILGLVAGGSVARGAADEYSDLDLVVVCADEHHSAVLAGSRAFAASIGSLLVAFTGEHVGEPRLLIALYDPGPRHVDLKYVAVSDLSSRVEDGLVLWARDQTVEQALLRSPAAWPKPDPQWIEDRFWVWVHYAAVKIARGELFEAVDALTFMRSAALAPLIVGDKVANPAGVRRIEQIAPSQVPALRETLADATTGDALRALRATVDLYQRLRSTARIERRSAAERASREYLQQLPCDLLHGRGSAAGPRASACRSACAAGLRPSAPLPGARRFPRGGCG